MVFWLLRRQIATCPVANIGFRFFSLFLSTQLYLLSLFIVFFRSGMTAYTAFQLRKVVLYHCSIVFHVPGSFLCIVSDPYKDPQFSVLHKYPFHSCDFLPFTLCSPAALSFPFTSQRVCFC